MLPKGSAEPGPFRSRRTPYMIPLQRAFNDTRYKGVVGVMGSQMGKTDSTANIIGERVDDDPVPIIYVGPTRHFVEKKWEPRFEAMMQSVPSLLAKQSGTGHDTRTLKRINGVNVHFVWGGSASSIAGQEAGLVIVDERDRMGVSVEGEGDIVELANARHETYADGRTGVFSTPTTGTVDTYRHPDTGIEHWKPSDQVGSPTWQLWQQGTRHEWMVPCPHCREHFAPRFKHLKFPRDVEPSALTEDNVMLACPACGALIHESQKNKLNEGGVALSPGQRVVDGAVVGDGVRSDWYTQWVSGLCSPWRSWLTAARRYLRAEREGSGAKLQAVINTAFGELYSVSGEAPPWQDVSALRLDYQLITPDFPDNPLPAGVSEILLSVDVQIDKLVYVVRGWSRHQRLKSWLLDYGEIPGATNESDVWDALGQMRLREFGDDSQRIVRCFVDQKYRAPYVFAFCRQHRGWAFPIAGRLPRDNTPDAQKPLSTSNVEVNRRGKTLRGGEGGLQRWTLNTDFFKSWIHDRIGLGQRGGFFLAQDTDEDYCKQLVAEARVVTPNGRATWVQTSTANHYLDCEMMQVGCAYSRRLQHVQQPIVEKPQQTSSDPQTDAPTPQPPSPPRRVRRPGWVTAHRW